MPRPASNNNGATFAFEDTLWTAADVRQATDNLYALANK